MQFDPDRYRYPSRRTVTYARNGMVCTSMPLAAHAGAEILRRGGNAVDAAIAAAAALVVLEPVSNGLGSDAFAIVWMNGGLFGLNGSGVSPRALSYPALLSLCRDGRVPQDGWLPVMVPGAPSAWAELSRRFGRLPLQKTLVPAAGYAWDGYPVSVHAAKQWRAGYERFYPHRGEAAFSPWFDLFAPLGRPPEPGELFCCPEMAETLEELGETGCESYYRGPLAGKIGDFSARTGGYLTSEDLASYKAQWVSPISADYRGYQVYELPPNGHGIAVLMALNLLKDSPMPGDRNGAETYHRMIEAMKLAFCDAQAFVADPDAMDVPVSRLLSEGYARKRRELISGRALAPAPGDPYSGDTVYLCTADGEGNMVSYIQSNYMGFGSGIVVPGTGISLQNRGNNFSLDPQSPNCYAPGKKAYHTIIPGFLAKDGRPVGPFGVMGGFMQPQGHLQVLVNTVDYHMNPQESLDAPRFQWTGGRTVQLEREVPSHTALELERMGHQVEVVADNGSMGRGQIIWRMENGVLCGGAEPRCDGAVGCY